MFRFFRKTKPNLYQKKFLRYQKRRQAQCPLDLAKVRVPCETGLVSVVLPVYNGGDYVAQAVESVLRQTYRKLELIIVNDGSTDDTAERIAGYASDPRVQIISQENRKLPAALNRGFAAANGEFFTWLSADNLMLPDFLCTLVTELNEDPALGMVYGNMRLINSRGRILRGRRWYERPFFSGNVILPSITSELNTYPNNTIGAAFLYRASAAALVGGYSERRFGTEDYDFWMRMNELCEIRHSRAKKPLYLYRMHHRSLTARDKELGITQNRYKLMLFDDFRRDFLLSPILWDGPDGQGDRAAACELGGAVRICRRPDTNFLMDGYQFYVSAAADNLYRVPYGGGWYSASDPETEQALLETLARTELLRRFEARIESEKAYAKKLSVIVCTCGKSEVLEECMQSLCNQEDARGEYEILLVDNAQFETDYAAYIQTLKQRHLSAELRYVRMPLPGLSRARNAGLWAAVGENLLYIDDDAVAAPDLVRRMNDCFDAHPEAGVIGGEVALVVPRDVPPELVEGRRGLWSEFLIGTDYREVKQPHEFPFGACFGVRTQALMQLGGFRSEYGRVGDGYDGGEETQVCHMMKILHKKVGLCGAARVLHKVAASRFTPEHIEKTQAAARETAARLARDLYL